MMTTAQPLTLPLDGTSGDHVSAALHRPERPRRRQRSVLLVPGAGGNFAGSGLTALAEVLAGLGCTVVRANLPFAEAGRRAPKAESSVPGLRNALDSARQMTGDRGKWIVGGKSYGGRVASLAAADGMDALALLFYGYPLHPPGKLDRLRVDHWPRVNVPTLFLQGDRDPHCDLSLLETHLRKLPRRAQLEVVAGADHSLRVSRAASPSGKAAPEATVIAGLADPLKAWLRYLDQLDRESRAPRT